MATVKVPLAVLEPYMVRLPFVLWDRYIQGTDYVTVYGWIPRDDGRSDFVVLDIEEGRTEPVYHTSSVKYSREICHLLYGPGSGHVDCQRVECAGLPLPNVIRLEENKTMAPIAERGE